MDNLGVSENLGTILMIFVLVVIGGVVAVMATGIAGDEMGFEKPKFAMFDVGTIMGYDRYAPHNLDIPVIKISQIAGDELDIRYKGTHSGLEGTKLYLYDPDGNSKEITQSVTITGDSMDAGENYYIFYYYTNAAESKTKSMIWITNDIERITASKWGGVQKFSPSGTWRILVVDDDNRGTIIVDEKLEL